MNLWKDKACTANRRLFRPVVLCFFVFFLSNHKALPSSSHSSKFQPHTFPPSTVTRFPSPLFLRWSASRAWVQCLLHQPPLLLLVLVFPQTRDVMPPMEPQNRGGKWVRADGATPFFFLFFQQTLLIILISWSNESLLLQIVSFV